MTLQRIAVGAAGGPQGLLIQHVQRSAVPLGQLAEATAPDHKAILIVKSCADWRQVAVGADGIPAGLERPLARDGLGQDGPAVRRAI